MVIATLSLRHVRPGRSRALLVAALAASVFLNLLALADTPASPTSSVAESKGVRIEALIEGLNADTEGNHPLVESGFARIELSIRDSGTGRPISGLYPGGWLDVIPAGEDRSDTSCSDKVSSFLGGGLLNAAAVTLNRFFVLVLNGDGSVSVVDPQFDFGGQRLLANVIPDEPAVDWAIPPDGRKLLLAIPALQQILEVDTFSWKTSREIELPIGPTNLLVQPGGGRVWAAGKTSEGGSAVVALDAASGSVERIIEVGAGPHEMAFEADGRYLFVSSFGAGTVSVIDASEPRVLRVESLAGEPVAVEWSEAANAGVVLDRLGGLFIIDPSGRRETVQVSLPAGVRHMATAPGVPYALVAHPQNKTVEVIDLASANVVQRADVLGTPDEISFSDGLGYVHHADTELLFTFPIESLGRSPEINPITIPGGLKPPGTLIRRGSVNAVSQVLSENSVLIASPGDRAVYYYREGMAAPMGSFKTYARTPVGVAVLDRNFREQSPGIYETIGELPQPGRYDLVVLLDSPTVVHCFPFEVQADKATLARIEERMSIAWVAGQDDVVAGRARPLRIKLTRARDGLPVGGIQDLMVKATLPARWSATHRLEPVGDPEEGIYEMPFLPQDPGYHIFFFSSRSAGFVGGSTITLNLRVKEPEHAVPATGTQEVER